MSIFEWFELDTTCFHPLVLGHLEEVLPIMKIVLTRRGSRRRENMRLLMSLLAEKFVRLIRVNRSMLEEVERMEDRIHELSEYLDKVRAEKADLEERLHNLQNGSTASNDCEPEA